MKSNDEVASERDRFAVAFRADAPAEKQPDIEADDPFSVGFNGGEKLAASLVDPAGMRNNGLNSDGSYGDQPKSAAASAPVKSTGGSTPQSEIDLKSRLLHESAKKSGIKVTPGMSDAEIDKLILRKKLGR